MTVVQVVVDDGMSVGNNKELSSMPPNSKQSSTTTVWTVIERTSATSDALFLSYDKWATLYFPPSISAVGAALEV